jgi:hypothetical protein
MARDITPECGGGLDRQDPYFCFFFAATSEEMHGTERHYAAFRAGGVFGDISLRGVCGQFSVLWEGSVRIWGAWGMTDWLETGLKLKKEKGLGLTHHARLLCAFTVRLEALVPFPEWNIGW